MVGVAYRNLIQQIESRIVLQQNRVGILKVSTYPFIENSFSIQMQSLISHSLIPFFSMGRCYRGCTEVEMIGPLEG